MKVIVKGLVTYEFEAEIDLANPLVKDHADKEVLRSYLTGHYDLDLLKNDPADSQVLELELVEHWIDNRFEHDSLIRFVVDAIERSHDPEVK